MDEYSGNSSSGDQRGSSPLHRAGQLQPFIQEQCAEAVQVIAEQLQAQLHQLGQPAMDLPGAQLVEQALLLGTTQTSHVVTRAPRPAHGRLSLCEAGAAENLVHAVLTAASAQRVL